MVVRIVGALLALCVAIPSLSLAEHVNEIVVIIGDTTLLGTDLQPTPIAGTYNHAATGGSITIANVGTGGAQARVEMTNGTSDGTDDSISLINAKITANNASVTNFPITIKRKMTTGPTGNSVYYKMYAKGLFNQAIGSSINLGWYVKNPVSNGFLFLDSKQYTPGNLSFTIAPPGKLWPANMAGDRVLKVEFTLKLANGKWLDFDSTVSQPRMIRLYSSGAPDESKCNPGDTECVDQEEPLLTLPSQDEASKTVGLTKGFCEQMFKQPAQRPCINDKGKGD